MESLFAYIPEDRRLALAYGVPLPEVSTGAALFADISGFTPLTEALVQSLGPQRGAEELSRWLNLIYDALIAEVNRYRGSVMTFSGDAITCWFDDQRLAKRKSGAVSTHSLVPGVLRAVACAFAIQKTMQQFSSVEISSGNNGTHGTTVALAIKVAVSAGPVRRLLVGDPEIQVIDVVAGQTLNRLAACEHRAQKGEVLIDESAADILGERVNILEWRTDPAASWRFAVINDLKIKVKSDPWPDSPSEAMQSDLARTSLLPPIYERLMSGMGEFLTELRPATALFLNFGGIDYDRDPQAQFKLDTYIQAVQRILARFDSYLLNLTIGDKGSYFFASFGAPFAHEDDATRAVTAAMELRALKMEFITDLKIGISLGRTRTGAYGGQRRRTYGVLGDEVNMAARLMQSAPAGEAYINQPVQKATGDFFTWEELPPLRVKGKSQAVTAFRLIDKKTQRITHLQEAKYALPMVGRTAELAVINQKLDSVLQGRGQIIGITADVGMGKSRLVAEVIRLARQHHVIGYGGECQSYGTNTSYLAWQDIWRGFFGLDPTWPISEQIQALEQQLNLITPTFVQRLPLLAAVLNLQIPDNELTRSFNAKLRKESLEALLVDCLQHRSRVMPIFFVLEDCQWLDPLSQDLLEVVGRAIENLPVLIAFAYRPAQPDRSHLAGLIQQPHFTEIALSNLRAEEVSQLVALKLNQIYGENTGVLASLMEQITSRTEGNPFYIEELLNYLHDRGIDLLHPDLLRQTALPTSLYSLILSRIDQLSENQKTLIKVASVIGRLFRVAMLWGVYNQFGDLDRLSNDLEELDKLELTMLSSPEPELAYLFKHVLTQEVAYETLPFATRAMLHEQIGKYIESSSEQVLDQYVYLLAHHYDHSENLLKKCEYLLKAGEAAQADYSNAAAISYYERVLPLLPEDQEVSVLLKLGQVFELVGQWQAAEAVNRKAESMAERLGDQSARAQAQRALGLLMRKRGNYTEAEAWLERSSDTYLNIGDSAGVSLVLIDIGEIYRLQGKFNEAREYYEVSLGFASKIKWTNLRQAARAHILKGAGTVATWKGDYAVARELNRESLALNRALGNLPVVAALLNNLGIIARDQHDLVEARQMYEESLSVFRKLGDLWAVGQVLNNQAVVASDQGNFTEARQLLIESLAIRRQLGDKAGLSLSLTTLADVVLDEKDYPAVRPLLDESLAINRELGDQTMIAYLLEDYSGLAAAEAKPDYALKLAGFAAALRAGIGAPLPPTEQARLDRMLAPARAALSDAAAAEAFEHGHSLTLEQAIELALTPNHPASA